MKCIVCENGSVFNQDDDADDWVYCFAVKYILNFKKCWVGCNLSSYRL